MIREYVDLISGEITEIDSPTSVTLEFARTATANELQASFAMILDRRAVMAALNNPFIYQICINNMAALLGAAANRDAQRRM